MRGSSCCARIKASGLGLSAIVLIGLGLEVAPAQAASVARYTALQVSSGQALLAFDRDLARRANSRASAQGDDLFQNPLYRTLMAHRILVDAERTDLLQNRSEAELDAIDDNTLSNPKQYVIPVELAAEVAKAVRAEELRLRAVMGMLPVKVNRTGSSSQRAIQPSAGAGGQIDGREYPAGHWSLTFDDGPTKNYTPSIQHSLEQSGMRATFFWLLPAVRGLSGLAIQALGNGHEVAVHSISHPVLTRLRSNRLQDEVLGAQTGVASVTGASPRLFRCPYGACGAAGGAVRQMIASGGMISVMWNVDSLDWRDKRNPQRVIQRVRSQMIRQQRGIILFHDIQPGTPAAAGQIIDDLSQQRQVVLPVGVMVDRLNQSRRI